MPRSLCLISAAIALVVSLSAGTAFAQQTAPQELEEDAGGIGEGGPLLGWLALDVAGLNGILEQNGYRPFGQGMLLKGGAGGGGQLAGLRFGGMGASGNVTTVRGEKVAKLALGYGGFLLSYGLSSGKSYDLSIGTLIGGGGADLTLLDHRSESLETAISHPPNTVLKRGFFALQPRASFGLTVLPWLSVRVIGGYLLTFGDNWKQQDVELEGPPRSFNTWAVQFMIAFGGRDSEQEME